jgi:DNA-3-methyladenine glycosylase I
VDDRPRCDWPAGNPLSLDYHDREWGVPEHDDRALYEKLVLDGFQAGLSWIIVLRKREHIRRAFDGFDPEVVARYRAAKLERLLADPGVIRNRAKIESSVNNARCYLRLRDEGTRLSELLWQFVDGVPRQNRWQQQGDLPADTVESRAMSKELRARGFNFVGPTICYAFMQAVGMVNDHLVQCFRHRELAGKPPKRLPRRSRTDINGGK